MKLVSLIAAVATATVASIALSGSTLAACSDFAGVESNGFGNQTYMTSQGPNHLSAYQVGERLVYDGAARGACNVTNGGQIGIGHVFQGNVTGTGISLGFEQRGAFTQVQADLYGRNHQGAVYNHGFGARTNLNMDGEGHRAVIEQLGAFSNVEANISGRNSAVYITDRAAGGGTFVTVNGVNSVARITRN